jgi:hypothetical protein
VSRSITALTAPSDIEYLTGARLNLLVTGGSDLHGSRSLTSRSGMGAATKVNPRLLSRSKQRRPDVEAIAGA